MSNYTVRTVWQSMSDDSGGMGLVPGRLFWSREEAKELCDGWGAPPLPKEHKAITIDGQTFLLSSAVTVYNDCAEFERELALEKLTPKERKALGY